MTSANGCAWTSIGPTNINGRITSIAIDPGNNQRIFVTSVGGIWRSTDGGRRWQPVSDQFLATVFASVAVNGAEVVAGAGDPNGRFGAGGNGIWRSTSNGDPGTWSKVPDATFNNQFIARLRVDPSNGDIYAATSTGVFLGTHTGGATGALAFSRLDGFDAACDDMAVDFSSTPRVVHAAVARASATYARGVWKHTSSGWAQKDSGIPTTEIQRIAIALAASAPATLYVKASKNGTADARLEGRLLGIFKTTTGGEPTSGGGNAWARVAGDAPVDDSLWPAAPDGTQKGYSWWNNVIEVDPADANRVFTGGLGIYRSTDGANFTDISGGADAGWPMGPHADQHAIAFDPANSRIVWLGGDGGVYRTTAMSGSSWRWLDSSHGMVITEYYRLAGQQAMASLRSGGAQDNGTTVTFGNRTWYHPGGCDGFTVAIDASNAVTLYSNCNGGLNEFVNPIPGWRGGPTSIPWTSPVTLVDPLITDVSVAGAALSAGVAPVDATNTRTGPQILLKTTNGTSWTQANASSALATAQNITAIASAPSASFQTYYLGLSGPDQVRRTTTGGSTWETSPTALPGTPQKFAVDYSNADRAFMAVAGASNGILMTTNGKDWRTINGAGVTAWPTAAVPNSLVIDPNDARTLYVASSVGVLRGTLDSASPPNAAWAPFDEGLPDGMNATDIHAGRQSGLLTLSSYGHGAFQRDIRPDVTCAGRMLVVRDNIHDRGVGTSPSGLPDPEHPIPDPARSGFWKPDDTDAGRVYWWMSPDIRIDVPSADPVANTIASADHVEVETCPIEMASCPAGTVWDNNPVRGQPANAYVQVANAGVTPVTNVRVIALYADASNGLPDLPSNFWTTTFPAGSTACGALDTSTGWRAVDPSSPCQNIAVVNPAVPEARRFPWNVPTGQAEHTCMLTIVEAADDPIVAPMRGETRVWVLVPGDRHVGNRNLHVVNATASGSGSSGSSGAGTGWPKELEQPVTLSISTASLPGKLGVLLPQGFEGGPGLTRTAPRGNIDRAAVERARVDPSVMWLLDAPEVRLERLPLRRGEQMGAVFVWSTEGAAPGTYRFATLARSGDRAIGGNVWYLRVK